ncbi:MAG: hypothetical protein EBY17_04290 [Acidobacteriia bacterium]|nr:hypothetical protein [Terriglobia bacterium]
MYKSCFTQTLRYLVLVCCTAGLVLSQTDKASLSGLVSDPTGAGVMSAVVTVKAKGRGGERRTSTTADGHYLFALMTPGVYEMAVEAPGFKRFVATSLTLQVAQESTMNAQLALGSVAESVEVEANVSMLNTESAAQGTVISQEKIGALPLNGRQFIQLALLVPGANAGGRQVQQNSVRLNQVGSISSSGGRTNNNAFLLDGAANTDPDYNAISYVPILDTISEFQVQTGQFSAQYGRASGAQINVATRSGGNDYHFGAWEFLRNQELDSRPFNSIVSKLARNQRNQFGGTAGGRLVRDRLFFFGGYEALRLRSAGAVPTTVAVPTGLERTGDFSRLAAGIFDPATTRANGSASLRDPFPGGVIPSSRLNPATLAAMAVLPLPNVGTANFVNGSEVQRQDSNNYSIRMDYILKANISTFGRYSVSDENNVLPDVVINRYQVGGVRAQNAALGSTQSLGANKANEIRFGFNRLRYLNGLPEPVFTVGGASQALPRFLPSGYATMGGAGAYTGTQGGGTVLARNNTYQIYDNFSWQHGRQTLKFGADVMRIEYNRFENPNPLGTFTFTNGYTTRTAANDNTGSALASMLLGLTTQASRTIGPKTLYGRQNSAGIYFQDDIRLRSNLTLNLGLRYEVAPPVSDKHNGLSSLDFSKVPSPQAIFASGILASARPTLFVCGLGAYPGGCAYTDKNNWAPRIGVAWTVMPRTVIRAGAGLFYASTDNNGLYQMAITLPRNISQSLTAGNFVPSITNFNPFSGAVVGTTAVTQGSIDLHQRTSYSPQWSLTIQRELAKDVLVEAGYMATLGIKLQQNVQPNNSQPGSAAVDPRRPYAGLVYDAGVVFPSYITVQGTSVPVQQVNVYQMSAQSNYHAGFVRLEKRFARGFSLLSSYTFSKAISNAPQYRNSGGANGSENSPPQNSYNLSAERALASFDVRQRWVNSFVYDLPFGKGRNLLSSGVGGMVFGGWQVSGIWSMQAGFPFTINLAGDTAGIGGGTGGILIRANPVAGQNYVLDSAQRRTARWFNTGAFVAPPAFQFGAIGRNTVVGPGLVNVDITLARTIRIREKLSAQLRVEFFNLANHPNYNIVGRIINQPNFGSVLNQLDPRVIQLGVKFNY